MSSILNALKKVEGSGPDAVPPRHPLRHIPADLPAAPRRNRRRTYLAALAGAVVVVAGAVLFTGRGPDRTAEPVGAVHTVQAPLPAEPPTLPPPAVPPRTLAQSQPTPPPPPASMPEVAMPPEPAPEAMPPVQAPPPTARIRPRDTAPAAPPTLESRAAAPPRTAPVPERPAAARAPAVPARSPEDSLSRLEEGKLKVMAIAWAEDPGRRIAVVNGHIVKEGESVDGYTVTRIRKDDLIVGDGSRSWRVELNLRSQQ